MSLVGPVRASDTKYTFGQGATVRYYGWLHFAEQSVEDGLATTSNIVDPSGAVSRFGFFIEPLEGGGPLSFQFETGLGFRASSKTDQLFTPDAWNWKRTDLRQVQLIFKTGIGTFRLGQGSMAADGAAETDLGATVVVAKSTIPESHGAFLFRTNTGTLSSRTINSVFDNFDGLRRFRLRFDTRDFSGFSLAAAYGQEVLKSGDSNEYYDLALRYRRKGPNLDIQGAIGSTYTNGKTTPNLRKTLGSLSVFHHPSGLNLSLAGGQAGNGGGRYVYVKGGWNTNLVAAGPTKFAIESFRGQDYVTAASRSDMWGVAVIQNIDAHNLEIYAGYRGFAYDDKTPAIYRDIGALQVGARWRF